MARGTRLIDQDVDEPTAQVVHGQPYVVGPRNRVRDVGLGIERIRMDARDRRCRRQLVGSRPGGDGGRETPDRDIIDVPPRIAQPTSVVPMVQRTKTVSSPSATAEMS